MLVTILTSHVWDIFFLDWLNLLNNNYTTFKLINSLFFRPVNYDKKLNSWAATIAQWISQRLPSLALGSNPKHNIYAFSIHTVQILYSSFESECKKNKNKQKETRNDPFKKTLSTLTEGNCFEQKNVVWTCDFKQHKRIDHRQDADQILDEKWPRRMNLVRSQCSGIEQCEVGVCGRNLLTIILLK